jgi:hypothetical protein
VRQGRSEVLKRRVVVKKRQDTGVVQIVRTTHVDRTGPYNRSHEWYGLSTLHVRTGTIGRTNGTT